MRRRFKSRIQRTSPARQGSRGYILISLMLFLSLLAVAALAVLPSMAFQVKRDREEEMIHRGVAYSRGIRRFYKKFGRYPMRIEELEDTNNLRFIRKHYTDPMNVVEGKEQDFKILHMADVLGLIPTGLAGGGVVPGTTGAPGFSQSGSGQPQQTQTQTGTTASNAGTAASTTVTDTTSDTGSSDSSNTSSQNPSTSGFNGPTFGGGPVLGVASASKKQSVREFCKKTHYNEWKFIYDPSRDIGVTINSPWCPLTTGQGIGKNLNQPGTSPTQPAAGPQGAPAPATPTPNSDTPIQQ